MIKRILVGLGDVEHSAVATKQALRLAQTFDAQITGVTLLDVDRIAQVGPVPIGAGGAATELRHHRLQLARETIEQAITQFETQCREAGAQYDVKQESGDPFECLISLARYHDLIVCGLKNLFEHGVIDEPPVELTRLVEGGVRPLIAVSNQDRTISRVLVAYSGSVGSAKTMKRFIQIRPWPDASVRIVVFDKPTEVAQQLLDDAAEYCMAHDLHVETEHVPKSPKHNLLPYAKDWLTDAIVLGNSARSLLLRRVFGETALETIAHSDRTLFLCQ